MIIKKTSMRVLLTGGSGMLGKAITRLVASRPSIEIIAPRRADYDLTDRAAVKALLQDLRPDAVVHSAAKVGGIQANISQPYAFLTENIMMNTNLIEESYRAGIDKFLFVGTSCMYPKDYRNPLVEEDLLAAPLEPTNEGYAISKIAGAKACEYIACETNYAYRTIIPCNLYGPGDTFDPTRSHLVASIIAKIIKSQKNNHDVIEIWGDGEARREFLFVDDLASFMLDKLPELDSMPQYLNVGAISDHSVNEYYQIAAKTLGFEGSFSHDLTRPVGMRQKLMDSGKAIALGWRPQTDIHNGIQLTAQSYIEVA